MKTVTKTILCVLCLAVMSLLFCAGVYAEEEEAVPYIPAPVSVSNSGKSIKVKWDNVDGASSYRLYRKVDGTRTQIAELTQNSYTDTDVVNGKSYRYYIRACIDGVYSGYSEGKTIHHMKEPVHSSLKVKADGIKFTWKKVSGAQKYCVYRKVGSGEWKTVATVASDKNSYYDKNVSHGKTYKYKVASLKGESKSVAETVSTVKWLAPGNITKVSNTKDGIQLQWKSYKGITKYKLYRKKGNETSWTRIGILSDCTYTDKKVSNGVKYTYTIIQSDGKCEGSYISEGFSRVYFSAPSSVGISLSPKGVKLTWSKVGKIDGYYIYRKAVGESSYKKIATVKGADTRCYYDAKASFGKVNYYKVCAYKTGIPSGAYSTTVKIRALDPKKKAVALTFDDGPYRPTTNQILDCLEKYNARATFFVVGSRITTYSDCVVRAYKMGNEIGNHSYSHTIFTSVSKSTVVKEVDRTNALIKKYTGKNAAIVRAPGGSVNSNVKAAVKYPLVNWSLDTLDWKTRSKSATVSAIKSKVKDGSIVLMHDLYKPTANAACEIIPWLCKNGYQLVTVSELMQLKGISFKAGTLYNNAYVK